MLQLLDQFSIVPDVIDTIPSHPIRVKYPSGVEVNFGNELTPTSVKDQPIEVEWPAEPNALYTLCMTDPDAPSRSEPTFREVRHWLVVNIPGTQLDSGRTLVEYRGSGPPKDTGLHRYVFLVYKQNGLIAENEPFIPKTIRNGRWKFSIREFAKKYSMGEPIAANFYEAQYDDYVPILRDSYTD